MTQHENQSQAANIPPLSCAFVASNENEVTQAETRNESAPFYL